MEYLDLFCCLLSFVSASLILVLHVYSAKRGLSVLQSVGVKDSLLDAPCPLKREFSQVTHRAPIMLCGMGGVKTTLFP